MSATPFDIGLSRRGLLGTAAIGAIQSMTGCVTVDPAQNADQRAAGIVNAMTLDEKLLLLRSHFFLPPEFAARMPNAAPLAPPPDALMTAGYTLAVPRLNVPSMNASDAGLGVSQGLTPPPGGRRATSFPATVLTASTWNPDLAHAGGGAIGQEARANGIGIMLAGGCNLTRDPRCGRTFEYFGEDPLLAGVLAGASVKGIQSQGVLSTVKHFVLNEQESARSVIDEQIDPAALRESDLLAFQIAIEIGEPAAVMTAYNKLNGTYCSEHSWLLSDVLKRDWNYPGYVMSDWGNVHSTREAALAGLDQQSGQELDPQPFFGAPLKQAALADTQIAALLDDKVRRILRSMIVIGAFDDPPRPGGEINLETHADIAQETAEEGIVLLKNANAVLPLSGNISSMALIGENADVGMLSGGGSSQTTPPGAIVASAHLSPFGAPRVDHPSSPLRAIQAQAPNASVRFHDGADHASAAALAAECDVAIVIARRWDNEARDARDLTLPDAQDALISAVAAANSKTIVVLTTGGPVATPWLRDVEALLAAWYPGIRGAEALARILFGSVNPSGRLPVTFPRETQSLPRPEIVGIDLQLSPFSRSGPTSLTARMIEGADVGYRWHERQNTDVQFPFGFGLSYTRFALRSLQIERMGGSPRLACVASNLGDRTGKVVVQTYARPPRPGATRRLVGFKKVSLEPGESKLVTVNVEPRLLARFDVDANIWRIDAGTYEFAIGTSSLDIAETQSVELPDQQLRA